MLRSQLYDSVLQVRVSIPHFFYHYKEEYGVSFVPLYATIPFQFLVQKQFN
jgi:hypothetical protein